MSQNGVESLHASSVDAHMFDVSASAVSADTSATHITHQSTLLDRHCVSHIESCGTQAETVDTYAHYTDANITSSIVAVTSLTNTVTSLTNTVTSQPHRGAKRSLSIGSSAYTSNGRKVAPNSSPSVTTRFADPLSATVVKEEERESVVVTGDKRKYSECGDVLPSACTQEAADSSRQTASSSSTDECPQKSVSLRRRIRVSCYDRQSPVTHVKTEASAEAEHKALPLQDLQEDVVTRTVNNIRHREQWTSQEKCLFYEALSELGKDFDAVSDYISRKKHKLGLELSRSKHQVRFFYYRSLNKLAKYVPYYKDVKRCVYELYLLINYGEMRKRTNKLNTRTGQKLSELVYRGCTTLRAHGRMYRLRTPLCRALKQINHVLDSNDQISTHISSSTVVELVPADNHTWYYVQSLSHNPRVRVTLSTDCRVHVLLQALERRWQTLEERAVEQSCYRLNITPTCHTHGSRHTKSSRPSPHVLAARACTGSTLLPHVIRCLGTSAVSPAVNISLGKYLQLSRQRTVCQPRDGSVSTCPAGGASDTVAREQTVWAAPKPRIDFNNVLLVTDNAATTTATTPTTASVNTSGVVTSQTDGAVVTSQTDGAVVTSQTDGAVVTSQTDGGVVTSQTDGGVVNVVSAGALSAEWSSVDTNTPTLGQLRLAHGPHNVCLRLEYRWLPSGGVGSAPAPPCPAQRDSKHPAQPIHTHSTHSTHSSIELKSLCSSLLHLFQLARDFSHTQSCANLSKPILKPVDSCSIVQHLPLSISSPLPTMCAGATSRLLLQSSPGLSSENCVHCKQHQPRIFYLPASNNCALCTSGTTLPPGASGTGADERLGVEADARRSRKLRPTQHVGSVCSSNIHDTHEVHSITSAGAQTTRLAAGQNSGARITVRRVVPFTGPPAASAVTIVSASCSDHILTLTTTVTTTTTTITTSSSSVSATAPSVSVSDSAADNRFHTDWEHSTPSFSSILHSTVTHSLPGIYFNDSSITSFSSLFGSSAFSTGDFKSFPHIKDIKPIHFEHLSTNVNDTCTLHGPTTSAEASVEHSAVTCYKQQLEEEEEEDNVQDLFSASQLSNSDSCQGFMKLFNRSTSGSELNTPLRPMSESSVDRILVFNSETSDISLTSIFAAFDNSIN